MNHRTPSLLEASFSYRTECLILVTPSQSLAKQGKTGGAGAWDNFTYWSFTCQFFKQKLWTLDREGLEPFNEAGRKFVQYSTYLNA
ncbi:MAG: hypothetical protein HRU37_14245, partial [Roseibacillus sp.]|nr:hypothetical protein [Roseibacillus sp.]